MANRLTKTEWQEKVKLHYEDAFGCKVNNSEINTWWVYHTDSMQLSPIGFCRFEDAGIQFRSYECETPIWSANMSLGISRLPTPFYIQTHDTKPKTCKFYMNDDEYEMLLMFMGNDLGLFAKNFLRET